MALGVTMDHPEIPAIVDGFALGGPVADLVFRTGVLAADASYPSDGEPLAASAFGLDTVHLFKAAPMAGYHFEYDYTAAKLKILYGDLTAVADGALIEVPNATNLAATLTAVHFYVVGAVAVAHELS